MNSWQKWIKFGIPVFIIGTLVVCYVQWSFRLPTKTQSNIYYKADFNTDVDEWIDKDADWLQNFENRSGVVKVSRKQFVAPYLMKKFSIKESPPNSFVVHISIRVASLNEDATTIASLFFPVNSLTLTLNQQRRLGISTGFFDLPTYSTAPLAKLSSDRWHDIYIWFNGKEKQVSLYLDKRDILSVSWENDTYPLQEVWLGSIWIKGKYNYGVPADISYDKITIAGEGIIPTPSFDEYLVLKFLKIWQGIFLNSPLARG